MSTDSDVTEYVYLIGSEIGPLVKIGRSIDVPARLAAIQRMSPLRLSVLWQTAGGAELETALHRWFKAQRSHGEWFEFPDGDAPERIVQAIAEMAAEERRRRTERREARKARKVRKVWKAPRGKKVRARRRITPKRITRVQAQYQQVAGRLRQEIESGVYPSGSVLPAEPELAKRLGVTRPTVNRALARLRAEGLVHPQRGVGTTVTNEPRIRRARDFTNTPCSFREIIRTRVPERNEAAALGIDDDQRVMEIIRTTHASAGRAVEVTELVPAHRIELYSEWSADQWLPETW